jgi:hypothetical protein
MDVTMLAKFWGLEVTGWLCAVRVKLALILSLSGAACFAATDFQSGNAHLSL